MADTSKHGARQDEGSQFDATSEDTTVLDFLWGDEAMALAHGQLDAAQNAGRDGHEEGGLRGAVAKYGSWLKSLKGGS